MATPATAEVCAANLSLVANLYSLAPIFQRYGRHGAFSGPVTTVKVFEDNVLVWQMLESKGEGRVLVIEGGGSLRRALIAGNSTQLACNMGWAGVVVNGCIRDVRPSASTQ